jgi:hypothetical protein
MKFYPFFLIIILSLITFSCGIPDVITPRVTTDINVTVHNRGTQALTAQGIATQKYDANRCSSNGQAKSELARIEPNQSATVSTSIVCTDKVKTWVIIKKDLSNNAVAVPTSAFKNSEYFSTVTSGHITCDDYECFHSPY